MPVTAQGPGHDLVPAMTDDESFRPLITRCVVGRCVIYVDSSVW